MLLKEHNEELCRAVQSKSVSKNVMDTEAGVAKQVYRFSSTGETFVKNSGDDDTEAKCFLAEQAQEMAAYVQTPVASDFEEATEQSLELARQFSEKCKKLTAKLKKQNPHEKALEVCESVVLMFIFLNFEPQSKLAGHEAMAKVLLRRKEKECEQTVQDLKQKHRAEVVQLKVELGKAKRVAERGVNEVVVRNGFDTKERALLKRIDALTHERDWLAKTLKEERELIQSNHNANAQQREELRQAKLDLAEFETTKTRLIELEASVHNRTEVRDACAKLEVDRRRMQRDVKAAQARVQCMQEELERVKQCAREEESSDEL